MEPDFDEIDALTCVLEGVFPDDATLGLVYCDRAGTPISMARYVALHSSQAYVRVALDMVKGVRVSTVWLGAGPTVDDIFETMVFAGDDWAEAPMTLRYASEAQALAGHDQVLAEVKERMG